MKINISGIHTELTDSLKEHVNKKLAHLEQHYPFITNTHVTLEVSKSRHIASAQCHLPGQFEFIASAEAENMYTAIDLMERKLNQQAVAHKEKLNQRSHGSN